MKPGLQFLWDLVLSSLTMVGIGWWFFTTFGVNTASVVVAVADFGVGLGLTWWWALKRAVPDA